MTVGGEVCTVNAVAATEVNNTTKFNEHYNVILTVYASRST